MPPLSGRLASAAKALMGIPDFIAPPPGATKIDDPSVQQIRETTGGQLQPVVFAQQKWLLADLERCSEQAAGGDLTLIGSLWRSMRRDGLINGLAETRS